MRQAVVPKTGNSTHGRDPPALVLGNEAQVDTIHSVAAVTTPTDGCATRSLLELQRGQDTAYVQ